LSFIGIPAWLADDTTNPNICHRTTRRTARVIRLAPRLQGLPVAVSAPEPMLAKLDRSLAWRLVAALLTLHGRPAGCASFHYLGVLGLLGFSGPAALFALLEKLDAQVHESRAYAQSLGLSIKRA